MRRLLLIVALVVLAVLTGCGRKATREDCVTIVDKNIEVQLRAMGVNDKSVIDKREAELRASMKDEIDRCIGKHVTDGMMACVKKAETADQIDKCLR